MKKLVSLIILLALCISTCAVLSACNDAKDNSDPLAKAREYLYTVYKDKGEITATDYTRFAVLNVDDQTFTVEWTANVTSGSADAIKITTSEDGNTVTVDVNEKTDEEVKYTLKATIKDSAGKTSEIEWNYTLPAFKEFSWAEYVAAADDANIVVKGTITGIIAKSKGNSSNCLYFQDSDGGYYAYNLTTDPVTDDKLEVGMTIRITGKRDTYSGTYEIIESAIEVLDDGAKTEVVAADFTEKFTAAAALKDASITAQQGMLVTLKGVEISTQDTSSGYYRFKLGDKETYLRISSSVCPATTDEQNTIKTGHSEHLGWIANVTGVICVYDGAFYLTPVDGNAFEYVSLPARDDAGMVEFEKENLSFVTAVTDNSSYDLAAAGAGYKQVTITWTSDNACAVVADGKLTVTLPESDATVKLTATITSGSVTDTKVFEIAVDAAPSDVYLAEPISEVVTDKAFKFALYQANLGKTLYFTGEMSGNFFATSDKAAKAADVFAEAVEGGYRLYFKDGETKKYIDIYEYTAGKAGIQLTDKPNAVYTWNAELKIFVTTCAGAEYYLGTYNTFNTISASKTSYITGDNASKVGVSQFVAQLCNVKTADYKVTAIDAAAEGSFYFVLDQVNLGKKLYFAGDVNDSGYLVTSDKFDKAALVTVAKSGEGYTLKVGEKFIEVFENDSKKVRIHLVDAATGTWAWNETVKDFTYTLSGCQDAKNDAEYYLGTYNTFDTISASKISYITGDSASKVGVSQFPAYMSNVKLCELKKNVMEAPTADKAYLFALDQANLGKTLYFAGEMNGNFFATTDKRQKATSVYLEAVEGGYRLYFKDGEAKKYLDIYEYTAGKAGIQLTDKPNAVYTWNADLKILVTTCASAEYYLGTYNTFNTISTSKTSYITGDNASKVGVSQFVAQPVEYTLAD